MQRADWLISSGTSKFVARQVASLMKNEQKNLNLLLKVDPGSTFRNNFLQPATNVLLLVKFIAPGEKRETSTKTYNETMLRDKLRVFVSRISPPLGKTVADTINGTYARRMMGRLIVILSNVPRRSCIVIGCIYHGMIYKAISLFRISSLSLRIFFNISWCWKKKQESYQSP